MNYFIFLLALSAQVSCNNYYENFNWEYNPHLIEYETQNFFGNENLNTFENNNQNLIEIVNCNSLGQSSCLNTKQPLCATNGQQYLYFENQCQLEIRNYKELIEGRQEYFECPLYLCQPQCPQCPDVHDPACAMDLQTGKVEIFANSCEVDRRACLTNKDYRIVSRSKCTQEDTQNSHCPELLCTQKYRPVCAKFNNELREFLNNCELERARCFTNIDWQFVHEGPCYPVSDNTESESPTCPDVCTLEYRPICAKFNNELREFGNNCELRRTRCQTDNDWQFIHEGPCYPVTDNTEPPFSKCPDVCTLEYRPICAKFNNELREFGNICALHRTRCQTNNDWEVVNIGPCPKNPTECPKFCAKDLNPVCARFLTETREFPNICELQRTICETNMDWQVERIGPCFYEPRPQECPKFCTKEFRPVCARYGSEIREFSNGCELQRTVCETNIAWTIVNHGRCQEQESPCENEEFEPICARYDFDVKSFRNLCELAEEIKVTGKDWYILYKGECQNPVQSIITLEPYLTTPMSSASTIETPTSSAYDEYFTLTTTTSALVTTPESTTSSTESTTSSTESTTSSTESTTSSTVDNKDLSSTLDTTETTTSEISTTTETTTSEISTTTETTTSEISTTPTPIVPTPATTSPLTESTSSAGTEPTTSPYATTTYFAYTEPTTSPYATTTSFADTEPTTSPYATTTSSADTEYATSLYPKTTSSVDTKYTITPYATTTSLTDTEPTTIPYATTTSSADTKPTTSPYATTTSSADTESTTSPYATTTSADTQPTISPYEKTISSADTEYTTTPYAITTSYNEYSRENYRQSYSNECGESTNTEIEKSYDKESEGNSNPPKTISSVYYAIISKTTTTPTYNPIYSSANNQEISPYNQPLTAYNPVFNFPGILTKQPLSDYSQIQPNNLAATQNSRTNQPISKYFSPSYPSIIYKNPLSDQPIYDSIPDQTNSKEANSYGAQLPEIEPRISYNPSNFLAFLSHISKYGTAIFSSNATYNQQLPEQSYSSFNQPQIYSSSTEDLQNIPYGAAEHQLSQIRLPFLPISFTNLPLPYNLDESPPTGLNYLPIFSSNPSAQYSYGPPQTYSATVAQNNLPVHLIRSLQQPNRPYSSPSYS